MTILVGAGNPTGVLAQTTTDTFTLTIDYSKSLAAMVAAGNYDHANRLITDKNFPVGGGVSELEAILVHHPDRSITSDACIAELERQGLRPATMSELLAFGAQHPDQQREFPIVALGSVRTSPSGDRHIGCLWEDSCGRELGLGWYDGGWGVLYRFLAFRK